MTRFSRSPKVVLDSLSGIRQSMLKGETWSWVTQTSHTAIRIWVRDDLLHWTFTSVLSGFSSIWQERGISRVFSFPPNQKKSRRKPLMIYHSACTETPNHAM